MAIEIVVDAECCPEEQGDDAGILGLGEGRSRDMRGNLAVSFSRRQSQNDRCNEGRVQNGFSKYISHPVDGETFSGDRHCKGEARQGYFVRRVYKYSGAPMP